MNKLKLYTLVIIIFALTLGCNNQSKKYKGLEFQDLKISKFQNFEVILQNLKEINIPIDENLSKVINPSHIIDTCYAIRLQTLPKIVIGNIDEVIIHNEEIFILDIYNSKSVFVFDLKGKYLRKIGDVGNGPGEYPRPEAFDIDKKNNEILIFNGRRRKLLRYDINGKFIGNIDMEFGCRSFKVLKDGNIVLLTTVYANTHLGEIENRLVYVINRNGEIIAYGPKRNMDLEKITYSLPNNLLSKNTNITYSDRFSDTIYSIGNSNIKGMFSINLGENGIKREEIHNKSERELSDMLKNTNPAIPYFMGKHFQTKNHLYLNYSFKGKFVHCFYNKINSDLITGSIISNKNSYYPLFSNFCSSYKDYFISSINSYNYVQFEKIMKNIDTSFYSKPVQKKLLNEGVNEKNNPILFFYKFK